MTLYEIDKEIMECFDLETGELTNPEMFEALSMVKEQKIESIALWIKDLNAEAAALKAEKQAFADRQKAAETKAENLKKYLSGVLAGQKFKTDRCAVSFRTTTSVNITDELALPPQYVQVEYKADKNAIKAAIKNGETIEGAELVENLSMSIK